MYYNDVLELMEKNNEWTDFLKYLLVKTEQKIEKNILLRLAAQCWHMLTFYDFYDSSLINREYLINILEYSYDLFRLKFSEDSSCLWLFGYFITINPLDFYFIDDDVFKVEDLGETLIRKALCFEPENVFAQILVSNMDNSSPSHNFIDENCVFDTFSTNSEVDKYFIEIFTNQ